MAFTLRLATQADRAAIAVLIATSVRGLQGADYNEVEREKALATQFTTDSRLLADGTYFLAQTDAGEIAGCGGWSWRQTLHGGDHRVEHGSGEALDPAVDAARIRAIFVHPTWARMGLGTMILEAAEAAARAAGFRRFEMASTLTGVRLYQLRGYREVGRFSVGVGGSDAIEVVRMVKAD